MDKAERDKEANKDQRKQEARETPIIDGDARPDMPVDPAKQATGERNDKPGNDGKFESERMSDINSLEDYKDAKKP